MNAQPIEMLSHHPRGDHSVSSRGFSAAKLTAMQHLCRITPYIHVYVTNAPCAFADTRSVGNIYPMRVLSLLFLSLSANAAKAPLGEVKACAGKKIYIMDIGMFAKETGVPVCNLATVRTIPASFPSPDLLSSIGTEPLAFVPSLTDAKGGFCLGIAAMKAAVG